MSCNINKIVQLFFLKTFVTVYPILFLSCDFFFQSAQMASSERVMVLGFTVIYYETTRRHTIIRSDSSSGYSLNACRCSGSHTDVRLRHNV
jgi:hypothetical protein